MADWLTEQFAVFGVSSPNWMLILLAVVVVGMVF
jgi:hypothetical protein